MSTDTSSIRMARPRPRWPKFLAGFLAFLVALYILATSGFFIKTFIVPRVASSIGSDVVVEDVSLSPFSSVTIRGVKVTPKGEATLAEVKEIRARYSLLSILRGKMQVDEVTVDSPVVNVVQRADGSGNLATLLKSLPKSEEGKPKDSKSEPANLAVRNVAVKGGSLRFDATDALGARTQAEITGLTVGVDQLVNGQSTKINVDSTLGATLSGGPQAGRLGGRFGGTIEVGLGADLMPTAAKGGLKLDLAQATDAFKTFEALGVAIDTDFAKDDLRNFAIRFSQRGQELGRVSLRGPLDLTKKELRLAYEVAGLDRRVLALAGAASGLDLGDVKVSASGRFDVLKGGDMVASSGKLAVDSLSLGSGANRTPMVGVSTEYRVSVNLAEKSALVERLDVGGTVGGRESLKGTLDRAMNLSWDKAAPGFRESSFTLKLGPLNLAEWRAVLPTNPPTAIVTTDLKVTAEQAGKMLRYSMATTLDGLTAAIGTNQLRDATAKIRVDGTLTDFQAAMVESYQIDVRRGRDLLIGVSGIADWNTSTQQGGVQANVEGQIPTLLALHPVEGASFRNGDLKANFTATRKRNAGDTVDLSVSLGSLTGELAGSRLNDYQVNLVVTAGMRDDVIDVQRVNLTAQSGFNQGGTVMARVKYDLGKKQGSAEFNAIGLNESSLGPFLATALAPNRLVSVGLDIQGKADLNLAGNSTFSSGIRLTNLRVDDPAGRLPKTPLQLGVDLDAVTDTQRTEVRKLVIDLGATDRATNKLEITAKVDLSTNQPGPTTVKVASTGLDLTPLYNLFTSVTNAAPETASAPVAAKPNVEPAPVRLPIRDATFDIDIARVFLRQVDVASIKGQATAKNDVVALDAFGMNVNGAPVRARARANLAVPGYDYDLDFSADRVPLGPLANSFVTALSGAAQGEVIASAKIKGAGVTGTSLGRNLAGNFDFSVTNTLIKVPEKSIRLPALITTLIPILPEEINPAYLLGLIGKKDVLAEPIRVLEAHATMANGGVQLANTRVSSAAFLTTVEGGLRWADLVDNSPLNMPVSLAFASGGQMDALTKIGAVSGTVGKAGFDKDPLGIGKITIKVIPGAGRALNQGVNLLNEKTGGAVDKAGGVIRAIVPGGSGGTSTNTNAAPANPIGGLIRGITGGGAKPTNAAPAPAGTDTNAPKRFNPLNLLPGGGKK